MRLSADLGHIVTSKCEHCGQQIEVWQVIRFTRLARNGWHLEWCPFVERNRLVASNWN